MGLTGRAALRGKPLDEDCKKANTSRHEYGLDDNRVFCYGLFDSFGIDMAEKCINCGAFVNNAELPKEME